MFKICLKKRVMYQLEKYCVSEEVKNQMIVEMRKPKESHFLERSYGCLKDIIKTAFGLFWFSCVNIKKITKRIHLKMQLCIIGIKT